MKKPSNLTKIKLSSNKRYLSANGSSLLPLALRPRLFLWLGIILGLSFITNNIFESNVSAASITLTIPKDSISLTVNPNKDSGFAKSSPQTISVTTDDPAGYNLTIKARYDSDNTLKNGSNVLNSISKTTSEADYKSDISLNNTWGFLPSKLFNLETASTSDNTNFIPGPTTDPLIIDKTSGSNNDAPNSYDISIGAKVDNSLVSGTYSNTFIISATTNTLPKMQDFATMTKEKYDQTLNSMKLNEQYEYVDERDDKVYYVAKLADGNLWMTENLDFDLSTEKQLTPNDTDIPSNWTPSNSTFNTDTTTWDNNNRTTPQSYDPGNKCWNGTIYTSGDGSNGLNTRTISCQQHDKSHYYIGNYYSWSAAVAMNDTSNYNTDKEDLNQSICPAGWRLSRYDNDKSFIDLKNKANLDDGVNGNIHKAPYYFNYSGYWGGKDGAVWTIGSYASYWSSVVTSSGNSYKMNFGGNEDSQVLIGNNSRAFYYSVRCVARTPQTYTINYNLSDGSGVSSPQTVETNRNTLKLDSATPTKDGSEFKGWCDQETTTDSCSGTTYQPGDYYSLTTLSDPTINLYAMWGTSEPQNCGGTVKLADGKNWCKNDSSSSATWSQAKNICTQGNFRLPTQDEFSTLLLAYYPSAMYTYPGYVYSGSTSTFTTNWGVTSGSWWSLEGEHDNFYSFSGLILDSTYIQSCGVDGEFSSYNRVRCIQSSKSYTINYNANMTSTSNVPSTQTGQTPDNQVNLDPKTPQENSCGHAFKGWCSVQPNNLNYPSMSNCPGTLYQPGEPIPLPDNDNNITLYGMWQLEYECSLPGIID